MISNGRRLWTRLASLIIALVVLSSILAACGYAFDSSTIGSSGIEDPHMYMYVWAGDVQRKQPDRLVVLSYDQYSPDYGKVIGFTDIQGRVGSTTSRTTAVYRTI